MNVWWWLPIGLVAWFALAVAAGLWLGPVLRRCSQAREALDRQTLDRQAPDRQALNRQAGQQPVKRTAPPRHRRQAS
jgi:hypothetical protein